MWVIASVRGPPYGSADDAYVVEALDVLEERPPGRLPGEKSRGAPEDLVLLLEALHLAPQPGQLGRLGPLPGERLGRAGRQTLVPPAPELVGVHPELLGDRLQRPAALPEQPHGFGLELRGEPASRPR